MTRYEPIKVKVRHETDAAVLVGIEGHTKDEWIPKSQISYDDSDILEVGDEGTLYVAEWLLIEKGLV